jgi:hypothetical protein
MREGFYQPGRADTDGHVSHEERGGDERHHEEGMQPKAVGRDHQQGNDNQRAELPHRRRRKNQLAEVGTRPALVPQNGCQYAKRGGRQGDGRQNRRRLDEANRMHEKHAHHGHGKRQAPSSHGERQRPPLDFAKIDFEPHHEQQERQAKLAQHLHQTVGGCQIENMRADENAEQELNDHHRQAKAGRHLGKQRRERGNQSDQKQFRTKVFHDTLLALKQ